MAEKIKKRSEIAVKDKWRIEDLYKDDTAWREDYERVSAMAGELKSYQGHLGESPEHLLSYLVKSNEVSCLLERVYVYANQKYHEDTGNSTYQNLSDLAGTLSVQVESFNAFAVPEILAIPEQTLAGFMEQNTELKVYKRFLDEIMRQKPHILSGDMEELLAAAGDMAEAAGNIFSMFNNADIKFPVIQDENGEEIQISHARYMSLMQSADRRVRKDAFEGLYSSYERFKNTLASMYSSNVKKELFYAKARKYESSLAMALDDGNIPGAVYTNLIAAVHESLPSMYRYMKLRKKALGVDELHMYDIYTPIVEDAKITASFEEAKAMVLEGLKPLGQEYKDILQEGFADGWIDVYENEGKRSGAYSWGAYGTHPYVLLNYQGDLNNIFTLAHEMGHAIHSYYSDKNQPYPYAGYKIFVAEVASTCNEALLMHYMLDQTKDEKKKAYLLNYHLEQFRTTLFRQTMFAEFEMLTHDMSAKGETLTADTLCDIYRELNERYFGPDVVIDPKIAMEWARIPHFYTAFYVYQYATGYSAAIALSRKILEEGEDAVRDYIGKFLSGGSSMDPIDLLKAAGVDMSTREPVSAALSVFGELVEQLEEILK